MDAAAEAEKKAGWTYGGGLPGINDKPGEASFLRNHHLSGSWFLSFSPKVVPCGYPSSLPPFNGFPSPFRTPLLVLPIHAFTPQQMSELVSCIRGKKAHRRLDKLFWNPFLTGPLLGFGYLAHSPPYPFAAAIPAGCPSLADTAEGARWRRARRRRRGARTMRPAADTDDRGVGVLLSRLC